MTTPRERPPSRDGLDLLPPRTVLLEQPLDYIQADHFRQRSLCALLKRFAAAGTAPRAAADDVVAFMRRDLPLHHQDEDKDLFPRLRKRALPEDDLGGALQRLGEDHRRSDQMAGDIIAALGARPGEPTLRLDGGRRELMRAYAASEHRHLAIENAVILSIARIRLTRADLREMSRAMKNRRGA